MDNTFMMKKYFKVENRRTINNFFVNIFTLYNFQLHIIASLEFDTNSNCLRFAKACPPTYSHYCFMGFSSKMKVDFLTDQVKFIYSLRTSSHLTLLEK